MKHGRGWEGASLEFDAGCGIWRGCLHIGAASELFFFHIFALTRLDLRQLGFYLCWAGLIWPESSRIGWIELFRPTTETAETGRNRPWIRNRLWMRPKQPKSVIPQFYSEYFFASFVFSFLFYVFCLLLSLFCESRYSNVFFKNILIVKLCRKYK